MRKHACLSVHAASASARAEMAHKRLARVTMVVEALKVIVADTGSQTLGRIVDKLIGALK
jgi:hypothetical protein